MPFVETVPVEQAAGDVRAMYAQTQATLGFVANYAKAFSHRPDVYRAWQGLLGAIRGHLDPRRYELITLAAARAMRSSYCMLAHGSILARDFYSSAQLTTIAADPAAGGLAPVDVAIMDFAGQLVRDASAVTADDVRRLRGHGLTDTEIFDIAAAAAVRCFFSKLLDALGVEADAVFGGLDEVLKRQLSPGRPISPHAPECLPATPA
jgi:uncharacterized peroxidase-related enzyme